MMGNDGKNECTHTASQSHLLVPAPKSSSNKRQRLSSAMETQHTRSDSEKADSVFHLSAVKSSESSIKDWEEDNYPEGGREAWLVVFGSFCGTLACFGLMNTIGVLQDYLSRNQLLGEPASSIGWIFSIYLAVSFLCGLWIGPIFDVRGPKLLLASGGICLTTGILLTGISTKYWHFVLSFSLLSGFGSALIMTPTVVAIGHFFIVRRGLATGMALTGGSIGGLIYPLMLQKLLPAFGFAWTLRILAFMFVVLIFIAVILVKSRLPPKQGSTSWPDIRIFRDPAFCLCTIGVFFMEWALFVPLTYIGSFMISTGQASATSSLPFVLITALNAASTVGRCLPAHMGDKIGRYNAMILMVTLCSLSTLTLWLPATLLPGSSPAIKPIIIAFVIFFGFASGSNIGLTPVCVGQLCKTEDYGRYFATCYTLVSCASLTGIPIAGALLYAGKGNFTGMVLFMGICYAISCAAFTSARWYKVGTRMIIY